MNVKVVGSKTKAFREKVASLGFTLSEENPEVIITYGGDGTFIGSELKWPGIPKLGIRPAESSIKCPAHIDDEVLARLAANELQTSELLKLEARFNGQRVLAVNDVILRNTDPRSAVRFRVLLNGQPVTEELIADGLVVCTPFGSSAYFRSITRMMIRCGIGVAFNNCTDLLNHLVIGEEEKITVELTRGPATLAADNDPQTWALEAGQRIEIGASTETFRALAVDSLRCAECRYVHAPRRRY